MNTIEKRPDLHYTNQSTKYQSNISTYSHQYFNIYMKRLEQFRSVLGAKIALKWSDMYPVIRLRDLSQTHYDSCIVIGTIFKDQQLKPSVLKQLADMEQLVPQPAFTGKYFTDDTDTLYFEDEDQRYQLDGNIASSKLVTGVTAAILGAEISSTKFKVEDLCFPGLNNYIERPVFNGDVYVLFVSGLDIAHSLDSILPFKLLVQWISGSLGELQGIDASKISRVVVVGNSVSSKTDLQAKKQLQNENKELDSINTLDRLLLDAVQVVDVDLMPGENDPTSYNFPQRPIHHCMFPLSAPYRSMNCVSNPYAFSIEKNDEINQLRFLGTSGKPVEDVIRYSGGLDTAIEAMEECLKWGHVAPTAPDTLGCYPFYDSDPFIIDAAPHVFFAGNQQEFQTKMSVFDGKQVRLIAIPEFSKTREVCLLNLNNLDCCTICFDVIV